MAARPAYSCMMLSNLRLVVEAERLGDGADFLVGVEELLAVGVVGGHAGGELAAVLQVEQHPRHQPGHLFRTGQAAPDRMPRAGEVIDGGDAALVLQFSHRANIPERVG